MCGGGSSEAYIHHDQAGCSIQFAATPLVFRRTTYSIVTSSDVMEKLSTSGLGAVSFFFLNAAQQCRQYMN